MMKIVTPRIPRGFIYLEGEPETGFVIISKRRRNQFVWIPVHMLEANGTADNGVTFMEQFGRRTFGQPVDLTTKGFWEEETENFHQQREGILKYGGFYVSRYSISKDCYSRPARYPIVNIDLWRAISLAKNVETDFQEVSTQIPYGAEFDCILQWLAQSFPDGFEGIRRETNKKVDPIGISPTLKKSNEHKNWEINNLFDIDTNVSTWTYERYGQTQSRVTRGRGWTDMSANMGARNVVHPCTCYKDIGFRVVLHWNV